MSHSHSTPGEILPAPLGILDTTGQDRHALGRCALIGVCLARADDPSPIAAWLIPGQNYRLESQGAVWRVTGPAELATTLHHLVDRHGHITGHMPTEDGGGGVTLLHGRAYILRHSLVLTDYDGEIDRWELHPG
ncbi:hypothetical protein [Longispora urticae]